MGKTLHGVAFGTGGEFLKEGWEGWLNSAGSSMEITGSRLRISVNWANLSSDEGALEAQKFDLTL